MKTAGTHQHEDHPSYLRTAESQAATDSQPLSPPSIKQRAHAAAARPRHGNPLTLNGGFTLDGRNGSWMCS